MCEQTCWEHHNCPDRFKLSCPAFRERRGHECWKVSGVETRCKDTRDIKSYVNKNLVSCVACAFFIMQPNETIRRRELFERKRKELRREVELIKRIVIESIDRNEMTMVKILEDKIMTIERALG